MEQQENKRIKVLYIITKSVWGGAQKSVFDLAVSLPKEKFEVIVALGGNGPLKTKLESSNIKTVSIKSMERDVNILKELLNSLRIFFLIKREQPDVVHLHSSKAGGLGALISRILFVKKIIFTVHGWVFNEKRPAWQVPLIKALSWLTVVLCHKIIVLSEKEKRQTDNWPFLKGKVEVIPNGIKNINFMEKEKARELISKKIGVDLNTFKFVTGTIAELHRNKGLGNLIKAISMTENIASVIIGEGEERQKLEFLIKENNLEKKVFLVGHLENAPSILKAFDIFILPSLKEGLPFAILEAGLAEIPIISSAVGGIPEMIDHMKEGVLVQINNPKEIVRAIEYIENTKDFKEKCILEMKKKIEEKFSFEKQLKETTNLYR